MSGSYLFYVNANGKTNSCFIYVAVDNGVKEQFTINVITKVTRLKEVSKVILPFDVHIFSGQCILRYSSKSNFFNETWRYDMDNSSKMLVLHQNYLLQKETRVYI